MGKEGKKSKGSKKGGKPAGNHVPKQAKSELNREPQLTPQERIDAVRPFWQEQEHAKRVQLLTVDLATLKERSRQLAELTRQQAVAEVVDHEHLDMLAMGMDTSLEEVLDEGVSRLKQRPTWKLWTWPPDGKDFTDAEAFRQHVIEKHVREDLRKYLPRDDPKSPERPAEETFRKRMQDLLQRVQQQQQRHFEEMAARTAVGSNKEKVLRGKGDKGNREKGEKDKSEKDKQDKADKADSKAEKDSKADNKATGDSKDPEKDSKGEKSEKDGDKEAAEAKGGDATTAESNKPISIYRRRRHHAADAASLQRDNNIELINIMLEALEQEHEVLYQMLVLPITVYIMEALPEEGRETKDKVSGKLELSYEDFDRLLPDDLLHIMEWLQEKVDALTTRLKAEPREDDEAEEEENMGDVDLWALGEDNDSLTVNSKWLQHLQERLLGEDGHPRKVKAGEDPHQNGLVLEWVYGTIVSTAEKARDGAKRALGSYLPQPNEAHHALVRALEEQYVWDTRLQQARSLLADMLKSRLEAQELSKTYDIKPVPKAAKPEELPADDSLPDNVLIAILKREVLLTKAKLHYLLWEHITQERQLCTWKSQLKQGEPEFERLKKELEEVKHSHRGLDSTYRSQAEMERHRAQLADAAIEEQLEVQTAFREQGAMLQAIYDKKQRAEYELARKETEIKQLQGWKATVESLVDKMSDLVAAKNGQPAGDEEEGGEPAAINKADSSDLTWEQGGSAGALSPEQFMQLVKLRNHVQKDVRKQLYTDADDKLFFDSLKNEVKAIERRVEEGRVIIQHLEMQLLNVACDDPGIAVGAQLVLPMLQERLDGLAKQFAAERAELAESEIIRMEVEQAEREAADRERKRAAKAAKKDRLKSEKEKERADREAKEAAEAARKQQEAEERRLKEEEDRRKRAEALEALRRAEEEYMEARRRELLSDENGYWRQRMRMDEERAAVEAAVVSLTQGMQLDEAAMLQARVRSQADTHDTHRRRSPAPAAAAGRREPASVRVDGSGMIPEKADGVAGKLMMRAPSVSSCENDSKTTSDQTRHRSGLSAASGLATEPVSSTGKLAAARAPGAITASALPVAPNTPVPAQPAQPSSTTMKPAQVQAPPSAPAAPPAKPTTATTASAATVAAQAVAPAAPAAAAGAAPQPAAPAAPTAVPSMIAAQQQPSPSEQQSRPVVPTPAIYFGAVPVSVVTPPTRSSEPVDNKDAASAASSEAVPRPIAVVQPQQCQVVRPQVHAAPAAVPVQASTTQSAGPAPPPAAGNASAASAPGPQAMAAPAQYPHVPAAGAGTQPNLSGTLPTGQQPQQQQPAPHVPNAGPVGVQVTPVVPQHIRPMMSHSVHLPAANPAMMGNGPTPPNMAMRQANPTVGANQQQQQHPAARMPPSQMPMLHYAHHMGPAAPPGHVVVPGPMGPVYVYQNPAANAGMLPNGTHPGHMMHHMMSQPHAMMHHAMPPGMPAPQGMHGAQGQAGAPQVAPVPLPPQPSMLPVSPPPPPPPPAPAPASAQPKDAVAGNMSRSSSSAVDGKAPQEGTSNSTGVTPSAGTSDKSLNVAAKPFVPSVAKIIPVNPLPVPVQHVSSGMGNMVNSPSATANGPPAVPPNMANVPYGGMMPGQQPPVMQPPPGAYPGYPHTAMQPGMRGAPPHVQPPARQERGGPVPAFRANVAGAVRPQQPVLMPTSPQQAAFMMLPSGGWAGASMPLMMHPQMNPQQMAPPGTHMAGPQAPPPQPPTPHQAPQPHITMHGASHPLPPQMQMAIPGHSMPSHMHMHAMQQQGPALPQSAVPATGAQPPAQPQPQQPSGAASKTTDRSAGGAQSPNGPLDGSHGSDNSSTSEDSQGVQQQQHQQAATAQSEAHLHGAASHKEPPVSETLDQQTVQGTQAHMPGQESAQQVQPVDTAQTSPHAAAAPSSQGHGQSAVPQGDGTTNTQVPQSAPGSTSASQPRSWSAIAAQDKGQGTDHSPNRRSQPAGTASAAVSPGAGPTPGTPAATVTPGGQQGPGSSNISPGAGQAPPPSWKHMLQQKLSNVSPAQPSPRWAGTAPVGNFLAIQPVPLNGARLQATDSGTVTYTSRDGAASRSLQLIRGLRNGEGEYNCFLNVIIQSLWHLKPFREALLALPAPASDGQVANADAQVLQALSGIFRAMAAPPGVSTSSSTASRQTQPPSRGGSSGGLAGGTVSPASLRNALAALGQSAVRVEMSDMHDAAEVLGQILECLHRAEACAHASSTQANGPQSAHDITLPHKVKQALAGKPQQPTSTVHSLFGLDIQVPCPPEEDGSSHNGSAGGGKKMVRNQRSSGQLTILQNGPSSASSASGPGSDKAAGAGSDYVLQFTKFFHLVPAQGLRQAYADALLPSGTVGCSWEELLVTLESAGSTVGHAVDGEGRPVPTSTLLRRPRVFTLGVVWESPQVPPEAIRSTLAAIGQSVELPAVFRTPPAAISSWPPGPDSTYTLRAVVCYFGHHYLAFVLSEELSLWLCFDDADISLVGRWPDVCRLMLARRMQPSLLIYEDVAAA